MVDEIRQSIFPLILKETSVRKRGNLILDQINLNLDGTGATIIIGPNGSGKTTLLRLVNGLENPRAGDIEWALDKTQAQKQQAFVFQTPVLMRRSVIENIAYPLIVAGHQKAEAISRANVWCEKINLQNTAKREAHFLSGGERQKLSIARALITSPQLLLLDEPTTNLDGRSTREIETMLQEAGQSGTKILMATHDMGQAKRLADDVIFLHKGKVVEHTKASNFFIRPESAQAAAYLRGDIVE